MSRRSDYLSTKRLFIDEAIIYRRSDLSTKQSGGVHSKRQTSPENYSDFYYCEVNKIWNLKYHVVNIYLFYNFVSEKASLIVRRRDMGSLYKVLID